MHQGRSHQFILLPFVLIFIGCIQGSARAGDWLINSAPYTARVDVNKDGNELQLTNGLLRRTIRLKPNAATVALDNLNTGESLLRGVKPEAVVEIDGKRLNVGGLVGQSNYAFLRPDSIDQLKADPTAFQFVGYEVGKPVERFAWKQTRHHAPGVKWPPEGVTLRLDFAWPSQPANETGSEGNTNTQSRDILVSVHYELYNGLPCYSKWLTITNKTSSPVRLNKLTSEILAVVERASEVDELSIEGRTPPNMHVETDMAFGGMMATGANRRSYRWVPDPDFATQVNYEKKTPCLLEVGPDLGPAQEIAPGSTFESFRTWILPFDSTDRERCGLALRRMYRVIAPWTTENPIMMHLVASNEEAVRNAVDQCAETGFEMLILSFGSGFNMENEQPSTLEKAKTLSAYARSKGIQIGSYSLLASRAVGGGNDVEMPAGEKPVFGNSPCLESAWGQHYFERLYQFHRESGFTLLEHDGSYPGDFCMSEKHPGHHGLDDSRWNQWRKISDFYKWCRGQGFYLNVPDHYFLSGSSKTGMGYRETNWSLPRDQQVIHTRQNIFDGTWQKLPTMGWMFVPLTEYQGGGAAATIEPLKDHLDHYGRMLDSNFALGIQACYRGPRLYDTDQTRDLVKSKVAWFKAHREILESDLIHGRRADARDIDWMLHVNPLAKEKGMLVVFNPLDKPVTRNLKVNLYYTGLTDKASVHDGNEKLTTLPIARDYTIEIPVEVPANGMSWYVIE